jgi:hypothetical protein
MILTLRSGARFRAGFGHHRYSFIYSHKIPRAQEILGTEQTVQSAEHLASAMFWLGVPRTDGLVNSAMRLRGLGQRELMLDAVVVLFRHLRVARYSISGLGIVEIEDQFDFGTFAHETLHTLGAHDIYGMSGSNNGFSLMAATIVTRDPLFGWFTYGGALTETGAAGE